MTKPKISLEPSLPDELTASQTRKLSKKPERFRSEVYFTGRAIQGGRLEWVTTSVMILFHVLAITALFFFTWKGFLAAIFLYLLAGHVGICMGYHRLLTHRGYKVPRWLEYFFTICGTLALEGGPIAWVGTHRVHHQTSDREGDPHTPRDGKFWSHMGWVISGEALHADTNRYMRYVPDLAYNKFYLWLSKYHWVSIIAVAVALLAWGGWSAVLWGIFLRTVLGLHATWLVNSATHLWGSRRFATRDDSRNNWWVALLTGGEGWHNNHHAHPVSARHGLAWYELDTNYYAIWTLKKLGLARDIHVAKYDLKDPKPSGVS